jgi:hypothetical protein
MGTIAINLKLNDQGYSSGVDRARRSANQLKAALDGVGHNVPSQMQAASASIRLIEGDLARNVRAVERFITTIPGMGRALQAIFPMVGAAATVGILARMGEAAYKTAHELGQIRNVANDSFGKLNESGLMAADTLRVTNDKIEQQIALMEHKPVNEMALALDEARVRADQLATSLNNDYEQFKKIIEQTQSGMWSKLFNKGVDQTLGNQMTDQLANIRTLERMQRDALKQGDQAGADDLGAKLRAAQDAAIAFANSQVATRSGIANQGTVREAPYAKVYGDQGMNFDAIQNFKDLVSSQEDVADQQKRNTTDQGQLKSLEAQKKAAEAMKQAQEAIVQQWKKSFDEAKADNDMTVAQEGQFWVQRMETAKKGSLSYIAALDEVNKTIAEMRGQNMRGGKEFDNLSAQSYRPDSMDLSKGDTSAMQEQGRAAAEYLKNLNTGIALQHANANAIREASIQVDLMAGRMSKLDAAQAMAAVHAQEYRDAVNAIDQALANAQNLPEGFDKQATIAGLNNQRSQTAASYQIQSGQDQQAIAGQGLAQQMARMAQNWQDMTTKIAQVFAQTVSSFNDDIAKAMTGQGKKGDFGHTLMQAGQGLIKTGLQGAEGYALKALGIGGKADGSRQNPFYTIAVAGMGAPAGIDLSSPARTAQVGLQDLVPGTSFIRPFMDALPHFAAGGDILANYPSIVGENGPELFMPGSSGRIVPNHQLGGGGDTNHYYSIDARGAMDPEAVHAAVARALPHAVAASVQAVHAQGKRSPQGR